MSDDRAVAIGAGAVAAGPVSVYCDNQEPHAVHDFGFSVPDVVMRGRWPWSKGRLVRGGSTVYRCPGRPA